jgi:hypothetical protein
MARTIAGRPVEDEVDPPTAGGVSGMPPGLIVAEVKGEACPRRPADWAVVAPPLELVVTHESRRELALKPNE